ncbi:MAG: amylo-alpha-1,6-glucosidase [Chloroflexota bacterium]
MRATDSELAAIMRRRANEYTRPANVESTVETHVIKEQDLFMLTDIDGNIPDNNRQGLGLYLRDTRFLSTYDLLLGGQRPTVLFASAEKNCLLSVDLTNPDIEHGGDTIRNQTIGINRSRLVEAAIHEDITFVNYGRTSVELPLSLTFGADYRDIFEVRGYQMRERRGDVLPPVYGDRSLTLAYRGLDGIVRQTSIRFLDPPTLFDDFTATFDLHLAPREEVKIRLLISPVEGDEKQRPVSYDDARHALEKSYTGWLQQNTHVSTASDLFDEMFRRSILDLRLLLTQTEWGPVVTAGTPWFACVFGRDSLITALQSLMFCPDLARGTLRLLAHHQGHNVNPWREEEPGKIFHELRRGEMATLNEVPHSPYYGTADATPLWLILLCENFRWTGDLGLVEELWEPAMRALAWIDEYGDADGDGYVEYRCHSPGNLINHGWKDSAVSIFHADGSLAEQPIALAEVQGYVYAAKQGMAELCEMRGDLARAMSLRSEAAALRERFNRDFWMDDQDFFAFALDGQKQQVRTVTSNPGQALWAGIVDPALAKLMLPRFKRSDLLSGWGVRCVSQSEAGYNPMGYHLGTVWPHDVSLLVCGLRRYGFTHEALTIATQLYHAGLAFPYYRLPEVFTGFARTQNPYPVPYPVACRPQAWAAGTTLLLLQMYLGIYPDAGRERVTLDPALPRWLTDVRVANLQIGGSALELHYSLRGEHSTVQLLRKSGRLDVMI